MSELSVSLQSQVHIFLYAFAGGMLISFIYDLFRVKRRVMHSRSVVIHIDDILYWIIAAFVTFAVVSYSNEGEVRGYILIGAAVGVIFYTALLSRIIILILVNTIQGILRFLRLLAAVLAYPVRLLFRAFKIPTIIILRFSKRTTRRIWFFARRNCLQLVLWGKIYDSIRKKT